MMAASLGRRMGGVVLLCAACGVVASCGVDGPSAPPGPVPGEIAVTILGAAVDDGAILLEIGPGASGVEAGRGTLEVHSRAVRDRFSVAVFGPLAGGAVLRVGVEDVESLPTVRILEVAAEDGTLRSSLEGYGSRMEVIG